MATRIARATWFGGLIDGSGTISVGVPGPQVSYDFAARFEHGAGGNPEELIGGALAGCYSMSLAKELSDAGHKPVAIHTTARVHLEKQGDGFAIPKIEVETEADTPGLDHDEFQQVAQRAKDNCPVSNLLSAAETTLAAKMLAPAKS